MPSCSPTDAFPEPDQSRSRALRVLIPSPLGEIGIEFQDTVVTAVRIAPQGQERGLFSSLKEMTRSEFLDEALGRLLEYFAGARQSLDLEYRLDPGDSSDFPLRVLEETARIPYGTRRSYQSVAAQAGQPDSYRLVRSVLLANPIPILIPCHRVVPLKGGIGGYVAGPERKEWLLQLEAKAAGRQDSDPLDAP